MGFEGQVLSGSPKFTAARLRHPIQIVKPSTVQDTAGGVNLSNNTVVLQTFAAIEAMTAQEKWAAHEFASQVTHKVWIRHPRSAVPGGITANMQVWFNTRQFQIMGVLNPDERQDKLMLMCMELDDSVNQPSASPAESSL